FQARNIVQVVVVELLIERLEDRLDLGEIANPAGIRIHFTFDIHRHLEGMTMQAPALVACGYVRQKVRGLEHKLFEQFHGISLRWCAANSALNKARMLPVQALLT